MHGMAVPQALTLFHLSRTHQNLYKRISKWKNSLKPPSDVMMREIDMLQHGAVRVLVIASAQEEEEIIFIPALTSTSSTKTSTPTVSTLFALGSMPSWVDRGKMISSMTVCGKRTPTEVCHANIDSNTRNSHYNN
jgi:hypothetical protein